jgi:hypothetical protein
MYVFFNYIVIILIYIYCLIVILLILSMIEDMIFMINIDFACSEMIMSIIIRLKQFVKFV